MKTEHPEFTVTLRALPRDHGDLWRRLRAALKCLKRGYGLQCVAISEAKETTEASVTREQKSS